MPLFFVGLCAFGLEMRWQRDWFRN